VSLRALHRRLRPSGRAAHEQAADAIQSQHARWVLYAKTLPCVSLVRLSHFGKFQRTVCCIKANVCRHFGRLADD